MLEIKVVSLAICFLSLFVCTHGADKYTDENRPYEFGFTIEGEQHRHEKKDENGIIMGEFGFITADGVYHVTVYATDEQGRFKILSMKNIRVKPYPSAGEERAGHSLPFPPSANAPVLQGPSTLKTQQESKTINKEIASNAKSCSHCSIPTTTMKAPQLTDIAVVSKDRPIQGSSGSTPFQSNYPQNQKNPQVPISGVQGNLGLQEKQSFPASGLDQQNSPSGPNYAQPNAQQETVGVQQNYQQGLSSPNIPQQGFSSPNIPQQGFSSPNIPQQGFSSLNLPQQDFSSPNLPQQGNYDNQYNPQNGNEGNKNNKNQSPPVNKNSANQYYPQEVPNFTVKEIPNVNQNNPQQQHTNNNYEPQGALGQSQSEPSSFGQHGSVGNTGANNLQPPQSSLRNPKQYSDIAPSNYVNNPPQDFGALLASQGNQPISNKPTLVAAQMQIVPKDTDIYHKRPGEQDGLPEGLSVNDMKQLLYTFNYTVGFHGHHEEGYTNGAKQGYYYVTGRNGIRTRVDYIADEKGFRPKISQEVLELLSDDVPKPETEKEERFGLKGYEFKWLYYPTEAKKDNK